MKNIFLHITMTAILTIVGTCNLIAQTWIWTSTAGSITNDNASCIVNSPDGNLLVAGYFTGTANFGSFELISKGGTDGYVVKMNKDGEVIWAKSFSGTDEDRVESMKVLDNGSIVIGGIFKGEISDNNITAVSKGYYDVYVALLNDLGEAQWLKGIGGSSDEQVFGLDLDMYDNIIITGQFFGTIVEAGNIITSKGSCDLFVASIKISGVTKWITSAGGVNQDAGKAVACFGKDIFIAGFFDIEAYFGKTYIGGGGKGDAFVAKFDAIGNCEWVKAGAGSQTEMANAITISDDGTLFVAGVASEGALFNEDALSNNGLTDVFVASYNGLGDLLWVNSFGGEKAENASNIVLDSKGNVIISGSFTGTIRNNDLNIEAKGMADAMVLKMNNVGLVEDVYNYGGTGSEQINALYIDDNNEIYVAGYFEQQVTLIDYPIASAGGKDILIAKIGFGIDKSNNGDNQISNVNESSQFNPGLNISCYPNPSNGIITIAVLNQDEKVNVAIYSLTGQKVFESNNLSNTQTLDVTHLNKGTYLLSASNSENNYNNRLIIQ